MCPCIHTGDVAIVIISNYHVSIPAILYHIWKYGISHGPIVVTKCWLYLDFHGTVLLGPYSVWLELR